MECNEKARDIFEIFRFKEAQVDCLLGIGAIYRDRGHYKRHSDIYREVLRSAKKLIARKA